MATREMAILAFRIFGIYLFVSGLSFVRDLVYVFSGDITPTFSTSQVVIITVLTVLAPLLGLVFWFLADTFANRVTQDFESIDTQAPLDSDIRAIGFSVLGMFFLTRVIAKISQTVFMIASYNPRADAVDFPKYFFRKVTLVEHGPLAIELAIALWLLFGSVGLSGMVRRFRAAGLNAPEDQLN